MWKKGQALIPTWTAFAVVSLLEQHFDDLVDYEFTAKIEEDLDAIAAGTARRTSGSRGSTSATTARCPGSSGSSRRTSTRSTRRRSTRSRSATTPTGNLVVVKPGKYGPYVKRGDDTAGVPDDLPPDELTMDKALELLAAPKSDEPIGELDGFPVYAKNGRFGPYVQWGSPDQLPPGLDKPKMSSLFKTMVLERITVDEAEALLQLPRTVGVDPSDSQEIVASNGRYGPYVVKGKDFRSLDNEEQLLTITLDQAAAIFQQPKVYKRGGRNMAASGPLREFGTDPVSQRPVTAKDGRFGVYVTDGETNASIGKGDRIEEMLPERAYELLAIRRERRGDEGRFVRQAGGPQEGAGQTERRRRPRPRSRRRATVSPRLPERLAFDHKRG